MKTTNTALTVVNTDELSNPQRVTAKEIEVDATAHALLIGAELQRWNQQRAWCKTKMLFCWVALTANGLFAARGMSIPMLWLTFVPTILLTTITTWIFGIRYLETSDHLRRRTESARFGSHYNMIAAKARTLGTVRCPNTDLVNLHNLKSEFDDQFHPEYPDQLNDYRVKALEIVSDNIARSTALGNMN